MSEPQPSVQGNDRPPAIPPEVLAWLHDENSENLGAMELLLLIGNHPGEEDTMDQETGDIILS